MERQRIWHSLRLITLGMVCMAQEDASAKINIAIKAPSVVNTKEIKCPDLPSSCGLVTKSRKNQCPTFWYTHLAADSLESCGIAASSDINFSEFVSCARMYRNLSQFANLEYTRQFGNLPIHRGSCPALETFPVCNEVAPVAAGSFCRCPTGSVTAVAGCEPNDTGTDCLTTSIASQCGG